ncbi:hypothetical protein HY624_02655 [Candidatus Uhrbacteria bacterium]|nr:hypothetical protein [Candidatus Uhrbacteria bacterium]
MSEYLRHNLSIRDDEDILRIIRRHWTTFFWDYFFLFLFVVGPFFLIVPLFRWGINGSIIFFALLCVGVFLALRTFVSWYFNALVITSVRVIDIDQRGFLERHVAEVAFTHMRSIAMQRKGIAQTLFRHGNLMVSHGEDELIARNIPDPHWALAIIEKSREHIQETSAKVGSRTL